MFTVIAAKAGIHFSLFFKKNGFPITTSGMTAKNFASS